MSFFRYPGGKSKLKKIIVNKIQKYYENNDCYDTCLYVEPFFGAGSIGLHLMDSTPLKMAYLSDRDASIAELWNSIIETPDSFCEMVSKFTPLVDRFFDYKDFLSKEDIYEDFPHDAIQGLKIGFAKLAIHQMSFSGLGVMSGGPLGGVSQESDYKIDCRWNPKYIQKKIRKYHALLTRIDLSSNMVYSLDFSFAFRHLKEQGVPKFYYLDPPYFEKGNELYQYGFSNKDHKRLMEFLKEEKNPWILSYDNNEEIRKMYSWAEIREVNLNYTIKNSRQKKELLITSKDYCDLLNDNIRNEIF